MSRILFCLWILKCVISSLPSSEESTIIKDDYFECAQSPKTYKLEPNNEKRYAFIASNSTDINQINISEKIIPQRMVNFTDIYYLNINPVVYNPVCFYVLYCKQDIFQLKLKEKYNFYVLGNEKNEIMIEFELNDLLINKTVHLEISTKNNNTKFEDIYIYWKENTNKYIYHGNYLYKEDIKIIPLSKTIKIKINPILKDINKYDEFTVYAYITGRERYQELVTTCIVFFYFSVFCSFFILLSRCKDSGYEKCWETNLDGIGNKFKETYFWPCLKTKPEKKQ